MNQPTNQLNKTTTLVNLRPMPLTANQNICNSNENSMVDSHLVVDKFVTDKSRLERLSQRSGINKLNITHNPNQLNHSLSKTSSKSKFRYF